MRFDPARQPFALQLGGEFRDLAPAAFALRLQGGVEKFDFGGLRLEVLLRRPVGRFEIRRGARKPVAARGKLRVLVFQGPHPLFARAERAGELFGLGLELRGALVEVPVVARLSLRDGGGKVAFASGLRRQFLLERGDARAHRRHLLFLLLERRAQLGGLAQELGEIGVGLLALDAQRGVFRLQARLRLLR